MNKNYKYGQWIFVIVSLIIYYHIGYQLVRSNFVFVLFDFLILFGLFFGAVKYLNFNWYTTIILRLIFLFSIPALSDDFYRFIWDGTLSVSGINPFQFLPNSFTQNELYTNLNSKQYYSVYPPLLQLIFAIGASIGKQNILANVIVLRIFILVFDLGSIYFLSKILKFYNKPQKLINYYALNPLVIVELTGNLHFEAGMLCFLLWSFWLIISELSTSKKLSFSAILLAFSVLIKLLPLVFIPLIIKKIGFKKGLLFSVIVNLTVIIAFIPFLNFKLFMNIFSSINLYFQKFEFNASFYYLIKWFGLLIFKNNPIQVAGPLLSSIGAVSILYLSFSNKFEKVDFLTKSLFILAIYFFLATTVHPWYICTLVGLCCITDYRFPIVWSALGILSYAAYQNSDYHENLWLVGLEYFVLFAYMIFEIHTKKEKGFEI